MPRAPKRRALTGCCRLTLVPCHRPPPSRCVASSLALVLVVSIVGQRGQRHRRIHCRRAGGGGRSHPLLEESARANPDARIRPLTHVSVDRAYQAESVGGNSLDTILIAIRRSPNL
jgi:hypothetical protein